MKICSKCKEDLPIDQFARNKRRSDGRHSYCKPCQKLYKDQHYKKNRERYLAKAKRWDLKQYEKVLEYLKTHPCIDCGETDIVCLDFDHIDRKTKILSVSQAINIGWNWDRIYSEIRKCVVRCKNCHARVTARQFGWRRLTPS